LIIIHCCLCTSEALGLATNLHGESSDQEA